MAAFPDLYKKSILFEIWSASNDGAPSQILESFAFTLPPSSITINQTQRITTTPTPGGFFVDNYGLGQAKITISGETGNGEDRLSILGAGRVQKNITGQEAWFEFRDRITRYSQKGDNYIINFYDLTHKGSSLPLRNTDKTVDASFSEAWEVVLDESSSQRSERKPFFYPYSISLTGIRPLGTLNKKTLIKFEGSFADAIDAIQRLTTNISDFQTLVESKLNVLSDYKDQIVGVLDSVSILIRNVDSLGGQMLEFVKKLGGTFDDVISETSDILTSGIELIAFPANALAIVVSQYQRVVESAESLYTSIRADGEALLDKYSWDVVLDPVSEMEEEQHNMSIEINAISRISQKTGSRSSIGAINIDGENIPVYGFREYVVQGNTRLSSITRDFFGDQKYKEVISGINGIYANDELVPGQKIKIPLITPDTRYQGNEVYHGQQDSSDVIGRDIFVDESGRLKVSNNDYIFTQGDQTIQQVIMLRLSEQRGRQVDNNSYGIAGGIGEALSGIASFDYLATSIKETLVQDPRITEIRDHRYTRGDGDSLSLEFNVEIITKENINYREIL